MNRFSASNKLNRRSFLVGATGALGLPLLDSMRVRAAPGDPPRRIVLFYNPNGTVGENWFPSDATSETDFSLPAILQPFAPYRDKLLIVNGVNTTVGQDPANNGGPHQRCIQLHWST